MKRTSSLPSASRSSPSPPPANGVGPSTPRREGGEERPKKKKKKQCTEASSKSPGGELAASGSWHRPEEDGRGANVKKKAQPVSYSSFSIIGPVLLTFVCPMFAMLFTRVILEEKGNLSEIVGKVREIGILQMLVSSIWPHILGSQKAWIFILSFAAFQLVLMRLVPGKFKKGPVTPAGNTPVYKANGLLSFLLTVLVFSVSAFYFQWFNPAQVYDHFLDIIGALNLSSLIFCLLLYLKGKCLPSSTDSGATGNFIFDYFWGTELYPRVLGWDVKMVTNCRFGLMSWALLLLCFAAKQHELGMLSDSMVVTVALQLVYVAKFFHWEMGYMKSLDIMHDRAGYYLCWGCLVWVPSVYTSHTLYLTSHPTHLGYPLSAIILILGVTSIFLNYDADRQRELVRATKGECTIWCRKPKIINVTFHTSKGAEKKSILLASGWWGVSRHFHYIPEILAAFFWTMPALFTNALPYFYVAFLCILLTHRAWRDDQRCGQKYGKYWMEYCKAVPYRIIPFIY